MLVVGTKMNADGMYTALLTRDGSDRRALSRVVWARAGDPRSILSFDPTDSLPTSPTSGKWMLTRPVTTSCESESVTKGGMWARGGWGPASPTFAVLPAQQHILIAGAAGCCAQRINGIFSAVTGRDDSETSCHVTGFPLFEHQAGASWLGFHQQTGLWAVSSSSRAYCKS